MRSTNHRAVRLLTQSRFLFLQSVSLHADKTLSHSAEVGRTVLLATIRFFKVFPCLSLPSNFQSLNLLTASVTDSPRSLANFLTSLSQKVCFSLLVSADQEASILLPAHYQGDAWSDYRLLIGRPEIFLF